MIRTNITQWSGKGILAIMDQGLFALSNFSLNLLLARWLSPEDFGEFTVAYMSFLLAGTVHNGLLIEPMMVFGSSRYKNRLGAYFGTLVKEHWRFSGILGSVFLIAGFMAWVSESQGLAFSLAGIALAGPFILLLWLMRRACYVRLEPHLAMYAGGLYFLIMMTGVVLCWRQEWLSSFMAMCLLGGTSGATVFWLLRCLEVGVSHNGREQEETIREVHWNYAKWAISTSLLVWMAGNVSYVILPLLDSLESTAALRALLIVLMPLSQVITALGGIFLTAIVRIRTHSSFSRVINVTATGVMGLSLLYWGTVGFFHEPLIHWVFDGRYDRYAWLLWILGALPGCYGLTVVFGQAIRAMERPDQLFRVYGVAGLLTLILCVVLTMGWGMVGAVWAMVIGSIVSVVYVVWLYSRLDPSVMPCEETIAVTQS